MLQLEQRLCLTVPDRDWARCGSSEFDRASVPRPKAGTVTVTDTALETHQNRQARSKEGNAV